MTRMLTQDDLKAIGQVFEDKINDPQGVLNIKLDAMQEQLDDVKTIVDAVAKKVDEVGKNVDSVETRMLTLERLERYELGLTERYDRRYVRQSSQEKTSA